MVKKLYLIIFLLVCMGQLVFSQDRQNLLAQIDAKLSFMDSDFSAEYTIIQEKPGQHTSTQVATILRRDRRNTYTIIITSPLADKGKAYLKIDNSLWFYDPLAKRSQVTSAKDRFQNSSARNSDFTRSNLSNDYKVVNSSQARLGPFQCTVLELEAKHNEVTYPFMKIWVSDGDFLIRKSEEYSLSRSLLRTTLIPSYQIIRDKGVPMSISLIDAVRGARIDGKFVNEKTTITITKPSVDSLPDIVFTLAYLERVAR
jgi:outer membrane lipoprotein-sorting protein